MTRFNKIISNHLCLGCGLCASIGKAKGYKMTLNHKGFYTLSLPDRANRDSELENVMAACCPSVTMVGQGTSNVWGRNLLVRNAYSTDEEVRFKASSGGFVTAACEYLIASGKVDAILQVGVADYSHVQNLLKVSTTTGEIRSNCSSRYAPALMFDNLKQILDASDAIYALVGKSCDILCWKNFERLYPEYKGRVKYTMAIFCAGMPSYSATEEIISTFDSTREIQSVRYRGNGWPGSFTVKYDDGTERKVAYETAWMKYLGKDIHFRCKICPDSIGTIADISVGDSWLMKGGKVVFEEEPGISCILVHTEHGKNLVEEMEAHGSIATEPLTEEYLDKIQPNHIRKRLSSAFKLPVVKMMTPGVFKTRELNLLGMASKYNFARGIKEAIGVRKRYNQWKNQ